MCVSSGRTNPLAEGLKQTGLFPGLVGCLMWLANQTHPDIANAESQVHQLAQGDTLENGGWHFRICFCQE